MLHAEDCITDLLAKGLLDQELWILKIGDQIQPFDIGLKFLKSILIEFKDVLNNGLRSIKA